MCTEWTEPQDAGGVDSALGVHRVDTAPRTQVVWTAPLDVRGVDSTLGCMQCGQSSWMCMEWREPQDTGGVDSALDVHRVDGAPGRRQCRQHPWMCTERMEPQDTHGMDSAPGHEWGGRRPWHMRLMKSSTPSHPLPVQLQPLWGRHTRHHLQCPCR